MSPPRAGLLWDQPQILSRFIEDCGVTCELVTPQLVATPFFRGSFATLLVPTGFGNREYSRLLPALRASSCRIRRFIEGGGSLIVFGAAADRPDAYDWLPFHLTYHHQYGELQVTFNEAGRWSALFEGYDHDHLECDGWFPTYEGTVLASAHGNAVMVEATIGCGTVLVTTIHEYPSKAILATFCNREATLF